VRAAAGARVEPGARLAGPIYLGPGARIEAGAEVGPEAVVGAGAAVPAGARVRRAVLWDRTALSPGEQLEEAVAAGALRVAG
jgi:mannose-1-phosphate guanylyltransferase